MVIQGESIPLEEKERPGFDAKRSEAFANMVRLPGWRYFVDLLQHHAREREALLLTPTVSMDQVLGREFVKGEFNGLRMALELVPFTIQATRESQHPAEEMDDA